MGVKSTYWVDLCFGFFYIPILSLKTEHNTGGVPVPVCNIRKQCIYSVSVPLDSFCPTSVYVLLNSVRAQYIVPESSVHNIYCLVSFLHPHILQAQRKLTTYNLQGLVLVVGVSQPVYPDALLPCAVVHHCALPACTDNNLPEGLIQQSIV